MEIVQRAVRQAGAANSYIAMGGGRAEDAQHLVTENAIIGFWAAYRRVMGIADG